uniref:Matrix protein M n=1 Tax=Hefer Valley virus TaxID=3035973 RepID=A0AA49ETH8_9RHAB|nr:matrix protein M [Hefer Valley virus]
MISIRLIYLWVWVSSAIEIKQNIFNVPVNCVDEKDIKPTEIVCPKRYNELSLEAHHELIIGDEKIEKICRPALRDDDHVEGYVCRQQYWETECEETWYFATVINYHIRETVPDYESCQNAVKQLKEGVLIPPYYPPAGCFWNTKIQESIKFMVLIRHKSLLNPMDNQIHDSQFISSCNLDEVKKNGCKLKDITGIWIPDPETGLESEHCSKKHWECIGIKSYRSELDEKTRMWEAPEIGIINITKACKQDFCGYKGVVFDDGEWWGYTNDSEKELESSLVQPCKNRKPGIRIHNDHTEYETYDIKAELENERCQNTISKILNSESINTIDMAYLSPTRPGRDFAYRFEQVNWTEEFCLRWGTTGAIKNCQIPWTNNVRGGKVKKEYLGIGGYKRATCDFRPILDSDGDGYIDKNELHGHNVSDKFSQMKFSFRDSKDLSEAIEVGYNGMIKIKDKENNDSMYMVRTKSVYDGVEQRNRFMKFEVMEFEDVLTRYKGEGEVDTKELIVDLTPENRRNLSRTDFVQAVAKGGREIVSGIVGWFTGAAKIVRWTIWGIGGIVTTYAIYKLHRMLRKKKSKDNDSETQEEKIESSSDWYRASPKNKRKPTNLKKEGLYEEIDLGNDYSPNEHKYARKPPSNHGFFNV